MKTLMTALFVGALAVSVPVVKADDLVISPEVGVHFHDDVTVHKYKSHKWDSDVKVGVVLPGDVEYYDVPEKVVVANPKFKGYKYAYLNDHVYVVEPSSRKVIAVVE
jgi:hypothetical protein